MSNNLEFAQQLVAEGRSGDAGRLAHAVVELTARVAEAERRGAVRALRQMQSKAFNRYSVKPYVDEWLRAEADALENGAEF